MRVTALILCMAVAGCETTSVSQEEPLFDGKPLAHWVRQLHDLDLKRSDEAVFPVAAFRAPAVPHLAQALKSERYVIREHAARALYAIALERPGTEGVVPLLLTALRNENDEVRWWAVGALGEMRPTPPEAEGALQRMLEDPNEGVRDSAQKKLAQLTGTSAQER